MELNTCDESGTSIPHPDFGDNNAIITKKENGNLVFLKIILNVDQKHLVIKLVQQ